MLKLASVIVVFTILQLTLQAQDKVLLTDKPGTFKLEKQALNGQSPDLYGKGCACTKTESDAMLIKMVNLVGLIRETPVLADKKGFDSECLIYGGRCSSKFGYAVTADVKFWFKSWALYKGVERQWLNEPPQLIIEINQPDKFCDNGFNETDFSNSYNPTNPAFSEKATSAATIAINELFFQPGIKEVLKPGIDRYGDNVILYNPSQPLYWEQVTIREVYKLLLDYWKNVPDQRQVETIVPVLEKEFSKFSENEKDGFAYFGNPESLYRIASVKNDTPVMRQNAAYWNKNLPKSSIQFITLEIPKQNILKDKIEKCLKNGDGYYYVWLFLNELDIKLLQTQIE